MPAIDTQSILRVHQILASREVSPQVTEVCLAQGLDLNRLSYIKYLVVEGKLKDYKD